MTQTFSPLWAAETVRTTFEWGRIQSNADWILPIAICVAILVFVRYLYRRDSLELSPAWSWLLTGLRTATFLGLLLLYLQPHWRSEREEVRNSRVMLLIDTSLSMGIADNAPASTTNRAQQIAKALEESDFLARLRKIHDVVVLPFDEELKREQAVTLKKQAAAPEAEQGATPAADAEPVLPWHERLAPSGAATRLGQALRQLIHEERGAPVSGVVVFSDGGQNAGIAPDAAVEAAQEAKIPVFAVGVGSDRQPTNVAVSDLVTPARAYPQDRYTATGYLQSQGMTGQTITVEVLSRPAGNGADASPPSLGEVVASQQVTLGGDGEVLPVKFELTPNAPGRHTLTLRIRRVEGDRNPADDLREADIDIVDRKNRILLMADGPMRDYQFLRNQLFRDRNTAVDVLLQSGKPGMSQEAAKLLDAFPTTREQMYDYDCLIAFDPNWLDLQPSQIELLEKWVGEQGGGLIVVGGPIHTCRGTGGWVQNSAAQAIRNLYPVEFPGRLAAADNSMSASREPSPLVFTREGMDAGFLWLGDTAIASQQAWTSFSGVYSFCPVRGPKSGAIVYARVSDPHNVQGEQQPAYFVGQFYGAGSVFFMGSGEIWRLRALQEGYFEQFYTKLIRHVSQGRLLRGSSRGVLLVGQDRYLLGNTVEVRAQLTNARLEPLAAPSVAAKIIGPDRTSQSLSLQADPSRLGAYMGQFQATQEGTYRLELPIPESQHELLTRRIQVRTPNLERENPRRNDAVLSAIAKNTGGRYYVGLHSALAANSPSFLVEQLKDRTSVAIQPIAPNPQREEAWLRAMMVALCGLLCLEWLVRRLLKLA